MPGSPASALSKPAALQLAERLADRCARTLDGVAAVVLDGSLTLGDYVPGRSDVDLLVVVELPPSDAQAAALTEAVTGGEAPARVDLRVVTRAVAAAPTPLPPMELYVGLHRGIEVAARHPGERDLVVELSVCRAHGRSLLGAEPSALIGHVPDDWVLAVSDAQLADWQALEYSADDAELIVFTTCRAWRFAAERRHCSKAAAGEWALARDSGLAVVQDALRRRHGDPTLPIAERPVRELLALVRDRIAGAY